MGMLNPSPTASYLPPNPPAQAAGGSPVKCEETCHTDRSNVHKKNGSHSSAKSETSAANLAASNLAATTKRETCHGKFT